MNLKLKVSVVIPVFNTIQYLPDCIKTLMTQTLQDFELLFIDDYSTDGSYEFLTGEAKKNSKISVIRNNRNRGAAYSRNVGLQHISAKYVMFLDNDDLFDKDLIENAYKNAIETNADVVVWGYRFIKKNNDRAETYVVKLKEPRVVERREFGYEEWNEAGFSPWTKLFRTSFIKENGILFQDIPNCNDVAFTSKALFVAKRVAFLAHAPVIYNTARKSSLSYTRVRKKMYIMEAYEEIIRWLLERNNSHKEVRDCFCGIVLNMSFYMINDNISDEVKKSVLKSFRNSALLSDLAKEYIDQKMISPRIESIYKTLIKGGDIRAFSDNPYFWMGNLVEKILKESSNKNLNIALWGIGIRGKRFIDYINKIDTRISFVVDMDKDKQGKEYGGYLIHSYSEVEDQIDCIIILNDNMEEFVTNRAGNKRIINLERYDNR